MKNSQLLYIYFYPFSIFTFSNMFIKYLKLLFLFVLFYILLYSAFLCFTLCDFLSYVFHKFIFLFRKYFLISLISITYLKNYLILKLIFGYSISFSFFRDKLLHYLCLPSLPHGCLFLLMFVIFLLWRPTFSSCWFPWETSIIIVEDALLHHCFTFASRFAL